jgi:hypothetical protein
MLHGARMAAGPILPTSIEQIPHRVAWAAVRMSYRKLGDAWVRRERAGC